MNHNRKSSPKGGTVPLIVRASPNNLQACPIQFGSNKQGITQPRAAISELTKEMDGLRVAPKKKEEKLPENDELVSLRPDPIVPVERPSLPTNNEVNYYKGPDKSVFLFLPHPYKLKICGYLKINILHGHVYIFGNDLSVNSKKREMVIFGSPASEAILIETKKFQNTDNGFLKSFLQVKVPKQCEEIMRKLRPDDAVILITELQLPALFLSKLYVPPDKYPTVSSHTIFPEISNWVDCRIDKADSEVYSCLKTLDGWEKLPITDRMMVIGGGSLGKSTLCKFLVNRLLENHQHVLYIELDIGQGDYIPPGCIGTVLISEPVVGPNYVRVLPHEQLIHLGVVNVSYCVNQYLRGTSCLWNIVEKKYSAFPVVVNTMGFCKGVGVKITTEIISIIRPKSLIQIDAIDMPSKCFDYHFTPDKIESSNRLNYQLHVIQSELGVESNSVQRRGKRNQKLMSSWSSMLKPPHYSFNSVRPFRVSFSAITIGIAQSLAPKDVLSALNGCLVALCEAPRQKTRELQTDEGYFKLILKPGYQNCLSLGLIRGIDVEKKEIYIISPLNAKEMNRVKMLVMSGIEVPAGILVNQDVDNHVPYLVHNTNAAANAPIIRRHRSPSKS